MTRTFVIACAVCLSMAAIADAQSVTLTPSVVQLKGRTGQSTTQTLTISNLTTRELSFALEARDIVVRNGAREFVTAGEIAGSVAATAIFSPRALAVPAGESRSATVTLTLPEGARSRAVVALFRGVTPISNGTTTVMASLGTLLTFTLSDRVSVAADPPTVVAQTVTANAGFMQPFLNDGDEPVVLTGVVVVVDTRGRIMSRAAFEPRRALPGERLTMRTELAGELPAGTYRVLMTFAYEGRSWTQASQLVAQ